MIKLKNIGKELNEAKMTANEIVKLFKNKDDGWDDWGDMGNRAYVKNNNLVMIDSFYYNEDKALKLLQKDWKSGGYMYDYFYKEYGIKFKIIDTFSEFKAEGRHKKLTKDGIVGIVLKIS